MRSFRFLAKHYTTYPTRHFLIGSKPFFFSFFASAFLLLILSTPSFLLADVLFIYFGVQFS